MKDSIALLRQNEYAWRDVKQYGIDISDSMQKKFNI